MFSSARKEGGENQTGNDEGPVQSALQNALVLRQIFINLSTQELISSCSLVNKVWNFQARTYVKSHRSDCQVNLTSTSSPSTCGPCARLQEFSDMLNNINVIPFSFSSMSVVQKCETRNDSDLECKDYSHSIESIENIVSKIMNLKSLSIKLDGQSGSLCATNQYFLFLLLRENSQQLESLRVMWAIPKVLNSLMKIWAGELPKLERIEMEMSGLDLDLSADFFRTVVQGAHNLKALSPHTYCLFEALQMFPEVRHYQMLDRFDLQIRNEFRQRRECLNAGEVGPALAELHVHSCCPRFKRESLTVLNQLLRSSWLSLRALRMSLLLDHTSASDYLASSVVWPTLVNVKYFYLVTRGKAQEWPRTVGHFIDYTRIFPALECVTLDHRCYSDDDDQDSQQQQQDHNVGIPYVCTSVTKLDLELDFTQHHDSLSQLKTSFPSVRSLKFKNLGPKNLPPLDQVFDLWPQLELLILSGAKEPREGVWHNADAEFCGISHEEVETLWGKDEEFLRAFQIVPIRPCISTLPNFKALKIYASAWEWEMQEEEERFGTEPSRTFLSRVTKFLALERLPQLEFVEMTGMRLPVDRFDPCDGVRAR